MTTDARSSNMAPAQAEALVREYLAALSARELDKCLSLFATDATIEFQSGIFQGREAIEEWHRERFAAEFEVLDVESVTVNGNTVEIDAAIASSRLRAWKIGKLKGKATLSIQGGLITEARLAPKIYNPFERW